MLLDKLLFVAGLAHFAIASANVVAVRKFGYPTALAPTQRFIRQIFWMQNVFLVLILVGIGALCLGFATELRTTAMGRSISGFLSLFWGLRAAAQLFYYDRDKRREHRAFDLLFLAAFAFLVATFALAALGKI